MPINERDYMKFTEEERRVIYGGSPPAPPRGEQPAPNDDEPRERSSTPVTDFYRESALSLKVEHPFVIIVLSVVLGLAAAWLQGDEVVRELVSLL